ncbi:hypothetical protein HMPREF9713_03442 [Myroides odoratimimus CCUG 12700]|uniref:hypothetical protein n=1 Tax=Myroides odoratimimus TaxID=76832 RepID=UPI0003546E03|nr:hypothetical protein [Myroides odoratimimus]EPH06894.1 hypothetical protein HMPREF9713_03442 [Myroides odoratimimus CCUG 12700]
MANTDKIPSYYLIFDDNEEILEKCKDYVKVQGVECIPIFINPQEFYDPAENSFKTEVFKEKIEEKTKGISLGVIVTDWNIISENDTFKGIVGWDIVDIVLQTKPKLRSKPFIIFSTDSKNASKYILNKISEEVCNEKKTGDLTLHNFVSDILKLSVTFCKRDDQGSHFGEINTKIKEANTISNIVLDSLNKFGDHTISIGSPMYDGKKIGDLINDAGNDNLKGLKFIRDFIDLSIAHYTELD